MPNNTKQGGFSIVHILIVLVCLGLVALLWYMMKQAAQANEEKKIYAAAEVEINRFVDEASRLAPSKKEIRKYCSYSSAKFSKGTLSCTVRGTTRYSKLSGQQIRTILSELDKKQKKMGWKFLYDNTQNNKSTPSIISVKVYSFKDLNCGVDYEYKRNDIYGDSYDRALLTVDASCSGPAMREYYPV